MDWTALSEPLCQTDADTMLTPGNQAEEERLWDLVRHNGDALEDVVTTSQRYHHVLDCMDIHQVGSTRVDICMGRRTDSTTDNDTQPVQWNAWLHLLGRSVHLHYQGSRNNCRLDL